MLFDINPNDAVPIYAQIVQQIQFAIGCGELQPGDRLPSLRELARDLVVNHLTVKKAYSVLESRGLIQTRRGLGTFVAERIPNGTDDVFEEQLGIAVNIARRLGMSKQQVVESITRLWGLSEK